MAKKKISTLEFTSFNGVRLPEPMKIPVYYDDTFFAYVPEELSGLVAGSSKRYEGRGSVNRKLVEVICGESPDRIHTLLWQAYVAFFDNSIKETKIIIYEYKFNSSVHSKHNNDRGISFADTPALSLLWGFAYLVDFPDGRSKIFSAPYKGYGNICSPKWDTYTSEYKKKWMVWTEEREEFFKNMTTAMESMIGKLNDFFKKDMDQIALLVDQKTLLLDNKK